MDVFQLRDTLIRDYREYVSSFIRIRDHRIREKVDSWFEQGRLWPDPMVGLNPTFAIGGSVDELVADGTLHPSCKQIFRAGKSEKDPSGKPMNLYRHQVEAIQQSKAGHNYVLTTGTGSGKSLAYIIPIVDHVLRHPGKGIKAIVVYPMNALANSQEEELRKFLDHGLEGRPITFARYTGQEDEERRKEIQDNPPDIILTNYVMLELILTRVRDRDLVAAAQGLKFLVLDELHTYRGRQGADVGYLVRRLRHATGSHDLQVVGTSATLASGGTWDEQRAEVARVASLLFGDEVLAGNIVGETLERATREIDFTDPNVRAALKETVRSGTPPDDFEGFVRSPLSSWIEHTLGVDEIDGRLSRVTPRSITGPSGAASELATLTGETPEASADAIQKWLMQGQRILRPDGRFSVFAFRLHQFISKGDTVYASIDLPKNRFISLNAQTKMPEDRETALFPLVFCRACGQDYYSVVRKKHSNGEVTYEPEALADKTADEDTEIATGYLMVSDNDDPWPSNEAQALERVPDEWKEVDGRLKQYQRKSVPSLVRIIKTGAESNFGTHAAYISGTFKFCLSCGISYGGRASSEFTKLGTLGSEGRSTATTLLTMSMIRSLRAAEDLPKQARKVLSFTDNRQDASLQAGHFNDFVQVVQQRAALLRALQAAGPTGIVHDQLPQQVFDALGLEFEEYAKTKDLILNARDNTNAAFRDVLEYRVYVDLQRGWRLTAPNLEQVGLLEIEYKGLEELCSTEEFWSEELPIPLITASATERLRVTKALLDWMRRELALSTTTLSSQQQEQMRRRSDQLLEGQWAFDEKEVLTFAKVVFPRSRGSSDDRLYSFLSGRSAFASFLRRATTFAGHDHKISVTESEEIIKSLLGLLNRAGVVVETIPPRDKGDVSGYQVSAAAMIWRSGDGSRPFHDQIRVPNPPGEGGEANEFFVSLYSTVADIDPGSPEWAAGRLTGMEAAEHTAQVQNDDRQERELRFRAGDLPLLFCSPTMELGVDIAELNVVNMRNVPPTPANYAQRSGRAGRSGQPALVFTYCSRASQHDQYFFRRPELMVSGQVTPPRLDLANEDLVRSHVHALWLSESGLSLGRSLVDVLDLDVEEPKLLASVESHLDDPHARKRGTEAASQVLSDLDTTLAPSQWWSDDWLDRQMNHLRNSFEQSLERWIGLYTSARQSADRNSAIAKDPKRSPRDRDRAKGIRAEAERQLNLLYADESAIDSDFYSYRYFATEGFLPGYSFPRLPLSAFIPGIGRDGKGRFVSRPRFLAITEFGPRAFVYHEGARFQITRVILPASERKDPSTPGVLTTEIKRCSECGYLHHVSDESNPDRCERCNSLLTDSRKQMFRLHNVSTRRRNRINSDEEERQRQGFDIETAIRFSSREGKLSRTKATVLVAAEPALTLDYGDTADIWRINLGERRRKNPNRLGFLIDAETGDWARNQQEQVTDPDSPEDTETTRERVIPYVQDSRNCVILEPVSEQTPEFMATLASALKNAIQAEFQLEDQELVAEPLPSSDDRRSILFVEAAEGGAGVLRRLVDEPDAVSKVASRALDILHFDAEGHDRQWPPGADQEEQCAVACYDCLLGYRNQFDHLLMDRHLIRDNLLNLVNSTTEIEKARELRTQSPLEDAFLQFLRERHLRLPSDSQRLIEAAGTRPDFTYDDEFVAIYIDGPVHEFPDRHERDGIASGALRDLGYTVIRFGHQEDWDEITSSYPDVFGRPS